MGASIKWVLLVLAVVTGLSFGQPSPPAAGKAGDSAGKTSEPAKPEDSGDKALERLISQALRNNPDVMAAESKVREAEAELRRAKLVLALRVNEQRIAVENQRKIAQAAEAEYQMYWNSWKAKAGSETDMLNFQQKMLFAKAQLAQAEATLNTTVGVLPKGVSLGTGGPAGGPPLSGVPGGSAAGPPAGIGSNLGISGNIAGISGISGIGGNISGGISGLGGGVSGGIAGVGNLGGIGGISGGLGMLGGGFGPSVPPPQTPRVDMADRIRAALDTTVKVTPIKEKPLVEVLSAHRAAGRDVPFLINLGDKAQEPVSLSLEGDVQRGALYQALEDVVPGLKFYVRDYGILATLEEQQPESAMPLVEFWRKKRPAEKDK